MAQRPMPGNSPAENIAATGRAPRPPLALPGSSAPSASAAAGRNPLARLPASLVRAGTSGPSSLLGKAGKPQPPPPWGSAAHPGHCGTAGETATPQPQSAARTANAPPPAAGQAAGAWRLRPCPRTTNRFGSPGPRGAAPRAALVATAPPSPWRRRKRRGRTPSPLRSPAAAGGRAASSGSEREPSQARHSPLLSLAERYSHPFLRARSQKRSTSAARSCGCSSAAKWPPFGISDHCCTLYAAAAHRRGTR